MCESGGADQKRKEETDDRRFIQQQMNAIHDADRLEREKREEAADKAIVAHRIRSIKHWKDVAASASVEAERLRAQPRLQLRLPGTQTPDEATSQPPEYEMDPVLIKDLLPGDRQAVAYERLRQQTNVAESHKLRLLDQKAHLTDVIATLEEHVETLQVGQVQTRRKHVRLRQASCPCTQVQNSVPCPLLLTRPCPVC